MSNNGWWDSNQESSTADAYGNSNKVRDPSIKEAARNGPEPAEALSKDATEMWIQFPLPIPKEDKIRVFLSGPTDSITVNDILEFESKDASELRDFVTAQFSSMKKIRVHFFLERTADIEEVAANLHQVLFQLLPLSADCVFAIHAVMTDGQRVLSGQPKVIAPPTDDGLALEPIWKDERQATPIIIKQFQKLAVNENQSVVFE